MRSFKNISSDLNEQVPNDWEVTKLYLIANLRRGPFGGALKVDSFVPEGYAVYEQQHAIHKKLSNIRYFIDEKKYKEMQAFKVEENDILLSCSGTIGESVIIPANYKEGIINQALLRIRLLRPDINIEYFKYYMDSFLFQTLITDNSHGSAMKNIASMNVINKIPVPVPSEDEQEKIVLMLNSKLKVLDRTIDMKYKILELLEEQRQSIITESVTKGLNPNMKMKDSGVEWIGEIPEHWLFTRLDFVSRVKARLGWKGLKAEEYVEDGYAFLATPNLKERNIDFKNVNYITEERYLESPEIMLEVGDVLLAKDGSTLGIVNVVRSLPKNATVNSSIAVIRPTEKIDSVYFYYYLKSTYIQDVINQIKDGMGVPHLFQADIKKFKILLPPMDEQEVIAKYLDEETLILEQLVGKVKQQIEALKEYRQSLIYEAVTGKIDVRDMELDEVR